MSILRAATTPTEGRAASRRGEGPRSGPAPHAHEPGAPAVKPSGSTPRHYSFGGTAAIVTSVGLIVGLGAATVSRATIVSGLLIIAVADNVSDSLSIHVYQESENLEAGAAFRATLWNFVARFIVAMSFVAEVVLVPPSLVVAVALGWGMVLLAGLTYRVARQRRVSPGREMLKHVLVALAVIAVSRMLGGWIATHVS